MNTFALTQEFKALDELMNEINEETGEFLNSPEDIQEYIDALEMNRGDKLDSIERLKRDNASKIDAITAEVKRLQAFANQIKKNNERLTDLQFLLTGGNKIETNFYKFSSRRSKSVEIIDERLLDERFLNRKETVAPDKKAITEALKNGEVVLGADFKESVSLTVK